MSYDTQLAERIRSHCTEMPNADERKMFGGLAFLVNGNMAVAANRDGGLMVRVNPDETDEFLPTSPALLVEMRGREMRGWLHLDAKHVEDEQDLSHWITVGKTYAASLMPKR